MKKLIALFIGAASLLALTTSGSSKYYFAQVDKLMMTDTIPQADTTNKLLYNKTPNDTFGGLKDMTDSNEKSKTDTSAMKTNHLKFLKKQ